MSPDCDIYCYHQGQKVMVGCMNTMLICQAVSSVVGRVKIGRTTNKVMWHCQTHQGFIAQLPSMARQVSRALLQKWGKEHGKAPVLCCYSQCKLAIWHTGSQVSHRTKTLPGLLPALTDNLWTLWQMHKQQLGRVKTCKSVFSMSCLGWDMSPEGQGPKISWAHLKWSLKGCHGTCDSKSCNLCWCLLWNKYLLYHTCSRVAGNPQCQPQNNCHAQPAEHPSSSACYEMMPISFFFTLLYICWLIPCHVIVMWSHSDSLYLWQLLFRHVYCSVTHCPGWLHCPCDVYCSRDSIVLHYYKY